MTTNITRRTLTRGVAWTTPIAVLAANAPAYATSGTTPIATKDAEACKLPGKSCVDEKGYILPVRVVNTDTQPIRVTGATFGLTESCAQDTLPPFTWVPNPGQVLPLTIAGGSSVVLNLLAVGNDDSANQCFDMVVCVTWDHGPGDMDPHSEACLMFEVRETAPCKGCAP